MLQNDNLPLPHLLAALKIKASNVMEALLRAQGNSPEGGTPEPFNPSAALSATTIALGLWAQSR